MIMHWSAVALVALFWIHKKVSWIVAGANNRYRQRHDVKTPIGEMGSPTGRRSENRSSFRPQ
jgi:hypothetical protein